MSTNITTWMVSRHKAMKLMAKGANQQNAERPSF
jgi:hypothetical protein